MQRAKNQLITFICKGKANQQHWLKVYQITLTRDKICRQMKALAESTTEVDFSIVELTLAISEYNKDPFLSPRVTVNVRNS